MFVAEPVAEPEMMAEATVTTEVSPYVYDDSAFWRTKASEAAAEPEAVAEGPADVEMSYTPFTGYEAPAAEAPVVEPETAYWPHEDTIWELPEPEAAAEAEALAEPEGFAEAIAEPAASYWSQENTVWELPAVEVEPDVAGEATIEAPSYEDSSPEAEEPEASEPAPPIEVTIRGRVQVRIAPVPDFDRLLNLDGALGRVSGVDSVTLADYAQEEVTFRVEVLGDKDAGLFTREIAEAAGVNATLVEAVDNGLIVRIN
jgi:hypothetical protein